MLNDVMDRQDTQTLMRNAVMEALSQRNVRNFKYQLMKAHQAMSAHETKYSHFDLQNIHAYRAELSAP